jgi:hypothetical protein
VPTRRREPNRSTSVNSNPVPVRDSIVAVLVACDPAKTKMARIVSGPFLHTTAAALQSSVGTPAPRSPLPGEGLDRANQEHQSAGNGMLFALQLISVPRIPAALGSMAKRPLGARLDSVQALTVWGDHVVITERSTPGEVSGPRQ